MTWSRQCYLFLHRDTCCRWSYLPEVYFSLHGDGCCWDDRNEVISFPSRTPARRVNWLSEEAEKQRRQDRQNQFREDVITLTKNKQTNSERQRKRAGRVNPMSVLSKRVEINEQTRKQNLSYTHTLFQQNTLLPNWQNCQGCGRVPFTSAVGMLCIARKQ